MKNYLQMRRSWQDFLWTVAAGGCNKAHIYSIICVVSKNNCDIVYDPNIQQDLVKSFFDSLW